MSKAKDRATLESFGRLPMAYELTRADLVWLRTLVDAVLNAPTTEGGKIPARFLPSYVDDVEEYAGRASFPSAGESGKIYVDKATGNTYRWSGSAYVQISFAELAEAYVDAEHPGRNGLMSAQDKAALAGKAEKSEMAVTPGEGANADRTTIQLKQGTSAVVLVEHQDISGKAEKDELTVTDVVGSGTKRVTLKDGLHVDVIPASFAPAQASATNQLADKEFVNSSIATNTAAFRKTYNLVSDFGLTVAATEPQVAEAIAAKLASLVPPVVPENNDYCFVQVPYDEDPVDPTHINHVDRYKYSGADKVWRYEFTLNNSSFIAAQWAALNSGITKAAVDKLNGITTLVGQTMPEYPTQAELTTAVKSIFTALGGTVQ